MPKSEGEQNRTRSSPSGQSIFWKREREREGDSEKGVEDSSVNKSLELLGKKSVVPGLDAQTLPCVCSLKRVSGRADRAQSCPYYPQSRAPDSPGQAQIWKLQWANPWHCTHLSLAFSMCGPVVQSFLKKIKIKGQNPSINGLSSYLVTRHIKPLTLF